MHMPMKREHSTSITRIQPSSSNAPFRVDRAPPRARLSHDPAVALGHHEGVAAPCEPLGAVQAPRSQDVNLHQADAFRGA